jgi:hypothetical protein
VAFDIMTLGLNSHSVGLLYLWSADNIRKGTPNGLEGALGKPQIPSGENTFSLTLAKVHPHCCSFLHFPELQKALYQPSLPSRLPVRGSTMEKPCTTSETISFLHASNVTHSQRSTRLVSIVPISPAKTSKIVLHNIP